MTFKQIITVVGFNIIILLSCFIFTFGFKANAKPKVPPAVSSNFGDKGAFTSGKIPIIVGKVNKKGAYTDCFKQNPGFGMAGLKRHYVVGYHGGALLVCEWEAEK